MMTPNQGSGYRGGNGGQSYVEGCCSAPGGEGGNGAPAQPFSVGTDGGAGKVIIVW